MMHSARNVEQAFTLTELLIVIAIIAIIAVLAGVEIPPYDPAKTTAKKNIAQSEENNLVAAISQYYAVYSHLPASSNAVAAAGTNDFTFGTVCRTPAGSGRLSSIMVDTPGEYVYQNYNSEVVAILRDDNFWPEINKGARHIYNPQQTPFFIAEPALNTNSPGIGPDDVFRDPWGNPYIITLDLNQDHKCYDATLDRMYQLETQKPTGPLMVPGAAIVWSFGPSKTINLGQPLNKQTIITSF
jgi:prepilin-type N-terminal cleavage/methylation domain-containing protein